ncbi:hypothetical protein DXG01_005483 [Tephrocybe rancida]|nr:hypothetical protein DXG01_005483 [Tephrocybe rancida]
MNLNRPFKLFGKNETIPALPTIFVKTLKINTEGKVMTTEERFKAVSCYDTTLQDDVDRFSDSAKFTLDALEAISDVHPIVRGKLWFYDAPSSTIVHELDRLQDVKDPGDVKEDIGLDALLRKINNSVKKAGALCEWYLKKKKLSRYVKAYIYEPLLAECAKGFVDLEVELHRTLSVHTVMGVNTANTKLDEHGDRLLNIQSVLEAILIRLDTPLDREIRDSIWKHGGAEASIENDNVLLEIAEKCGDKRKLSAQDTDFQELKKGLLSELSEDVNLALEHNYNLFNLKLEIHLSTITSTLDKNRDHIVDSLSGAYKRIDDPDIQKIWKDMGWKITAKARHFALALRDFYMDRAGDKGAVHDTPQLALSPLVAPNATDEAGQMPQQSLSAATIKNSNDSWTTQYISISYLQSIAEAIDDDGSGFVSIREVNDFTEVRPPGWTTCQWLAYWAAGWRSSIEQYTDKIYRLLRKIHKLRSKVRPDNLRLLDGYLDKDPFFRLELLLRSSPQDSDIIQELAKLRNEFNADEERRLMVNLNYIKYNIDSPSTVPLITGRGRIERYIYPMVYLLLQQHLKIIQLGRSHTLHPDEFEDMSISLDSIFLVFQYRRDELSAIFKQMHIDPDRKFKDYAFGIFSNSDAPWDVSDHDQLAHIFSNLPYEPGEDDDDAIACPDIPDTILKYPAHKQPELESPSQLPIESDLRDHQEDLYGRWAGFCMTTIGEDRWVPHKGLFRMVFEQNRNKEEVLSGSADTYLGRLKMRYAVTHKDEMTLEVDFVIVDDDLDWIRCVGIFHASSASIQGVWYRRRSLLDQPPLPLSTLPAILNLPISLNADELASSTVEDRRHPGGKFWLSRTPAPLIKFRYQPEALLDNSARERWHFAISAIVYTIRCGKLSMRDATTRIRNIYSFVELSIDSLLSPDGPSFSSKKVKLWKFTTTLYPNLDQYYFATALRLYSRVTDVVNIQSLGIDILVLGTQSPGRDPGRDRYPSHNDSHSLIRVYQTLHDYSVAQVFRVARVVSKIIKEHARQRTTGKTFCNVCDEKHHMMPSPEKMYWRTASNTNNTAHNMHAMLWIRDDKYVDIPVFDQLSRVERHLTTVEDIVRGRLEKQPEGIVEEQVVAHLPGPPVPYTSRVEDLPGVGYLEQMEGKLSTRLDTVEAQLGQLIISLSKSNQLAEQRMERMEVEVADRLKSLEALLSRSQV